jgi:hypothetical protein
VRDGAERTCGAGRCGGRAVVVASPAGSDAGCAPEVLAAGVVVVGVAGCFGGVVLVVFFAAPLPAAAGFGALFPAALVLVAAFFAEAFGTATGSGAAVTASAASAGTIGSAPMSGVERRLARSPDARAAPAARAP